MNKQERDELNNYDDQVRELARGYFDEAIDDTRRLMGMPMPDYSQMKTPGKAELEEVFWRNHRARAIQQQFSLLKQLAKASSGELFGIKGDDTAAEQQRTESRELLTDAVRRAGLAHDDDD